MDNGQWTMDNGNTKTISPVSFKAEKKEYTPTGLYFKPGNHKCELKLEDCQINPIVNGNMTLMICVTGHGPICITGKRDELIKTLQALLKQLDPPARRINQASDNLIEDVLQ